MLNHLKFTGKETDLRETEYLALSYTPGGDGKGILTHVCLFLDLTVFQLSHTDSFGQVKLRQNVIDNVGT